MIPAYRPRPADPARGSMTGAPLKQRGLADDRPRTPHRRTHRPPGPCAARSSSEVTAVAPSTDRGPYRMTCENRPALLALADPAVARPEQQHRPADVRLAVTTSAEVASRKPAGAKNDARAERAARRRGAAASYSVTYLDSAQTPPAAATRRPRRCGCATAPDCA